jgi:hypothetical protein
VINPHYDLGSIDVCTVTGIYYDQAGFQRSKLGFEWGAQITQVLNFFQAQWEPAKRLLAKAEAKLETGRSKIARALSFGKRSLKLLFNDTKELIAKAKELFGNHPDHIEHGIDTIEEVAEH